MEHLDKRKFLIIILFMLTLFKPLNLTYYSFPKSFSMENEPRSLFTKYVGTTSHIIFQKVQVDLGHNINPNTSSILNALITWKFLSCLLLTLKILIIDVRKRIMALIISCFQGSNYKHYFFFSQSI